MAIELNDFVREVLAAPCFGFVVAINNSNQPVMTRFFGFKYDEEETTLTLFTFKKDAQQVLEHTSSGTKITATASNALDFNTLQFKGTCKGHYNVQEDEMDFIRDNYAKQVDIMQMIGVPDGAVANWKYDPSVAIVMNVVEIFDQTPKVNTGNKIL
jgi:hypothetical protein